MFRTALAITTRYSLKLVRIPADNTSEVLMHNNPLACNMRMLYYIHMARGTSGRIVVEIDPQEKRELYGALIQDGFTLKDWFLQQSARYLRNRNQVPLFVPAAEADQSLLPAHGKRRVRGGRGPASSPRISLRRNRP